MISQKRLAQEFVAIANQYYPELNEIISACYIKIIEYYSQRLRKRFYYVVIYYPSKIKESILTQKYTLKEVAENLGLVEAICIDARSIIRNPVLQLKQNDPKLWLELYWIAVRDN